MDDAKVQYYHDMLARDRAVMVIKDGHLAHLVTFFVGDDDEKYLFEHTPWEMIDDDPNGSTLYIDQLLTYKGRSAVRQAHREFAKLIRSLKEKFVNLKTVKWIRVGAQFRKHGITEGVKRYVHCKDIA